MMSGTVKRVICVALLASLAAACAPAQSGPAGTPSVTNVNPVTGARGGTNTGGGSGR